MQRGRSAGVWPTRLDEQAGGSEASLPFNGHSVLSWPLMPRWGKVY